MTTRRLNYTGRKRIRLEDARIYVLRGTGKPAEFEVSLRLREYGFPDDALIVVEAYRQSSLMRFSFGTIGFVQPPESQRLTELDPPDGVQFRVKVIDPKAQRGKLLGLASAIRPNLSEGPKGSADGILPVIPNELGEEVWRLQAGDGVEWPKLLINRNLANWRNVARDGRFSALVYPAVLRMVLLSSLDGGRPGEDDPEWARAWCAFAESLPGVPPAPEEERAGEDWVERAVEVFARQNGSFSRFLRLEEGES